MTAKLTDFYLLGRLAEYKYYNMDVMTRKAMDLADEILKK
jgi:UDP-galactopyranose mutase